MVGIGPFIPHYDTVFKDEKAGSVEMTLYLLSVVEFLSKCSPSRNNSSWNNGRKRKGEGASLWGKCSDAQSFSFKKQEAV